MNTPLIQAVTLIDQQPSNQVVVDCRFSLMDPDAGRAAYLEGHIPGAVYADLNRDLAAPVTATSGRHPLPELADFEAFLGAQGINNETAVVVYDDMSGAFAARLWWMLRAIGHSTVSVLDGGLKTYLAAGGELESGTREYPSVSYEAKHPWQFVTTDKLQSLSDSVLVDARNPERYRGQMEPIDPVAGHVPGAKNLSFDTNLNPQGLFRSKAEINANFHRVNPNNMPMVAMCGSGVTACHLLLARAVAGLEEGELYVGSWSEWITDPKRPVATL